MLKNKIQQDIIYIKEIFLKKKVINEEFNGSLKNNKFVFDKKQSKYLNELEL